MAKQADPKSRIDVLDACAQACDRCAGACLREEDAKAMARCIALDVDCAAICRLASAYVARGSDFAGELRSTCASVCRACAEECGRHSAEHCQQCAKACSRCAEACEDGGTSLGSLPA